MTNELKEPARLMFSAEDELLMNVLRAGEAELGTGDQLATVAAKLGPILGGGGGSGVGGSGAAGGTNAASPIIGGTTGKILGVLGICAAVSLSVGYLAVRPLFGGDHSSNVAPRPPAMTDLAQPIPAPVPNDEEPPPIQLPKPEKASSARPLDSSPSWRASSNQAAPLRVETLASSSSASSVQVETPEPEVRMLQRAQDALRVEPSQALSICDDHAARHPNGLLNQEREVIAIDALTRLGRADDAKARARRFKEAHPSSSHLGRLEVLVGKDF